MEASQKFKHIKEFWETNDKVTKDYLVCVNADLYRKVRQLKPK